jgi:hypothetical protein
MAKFVVDRRTWYRGEGSSDSRLLTEDGKRCCIGFVGQQCGIPDGALLNVAEVIQVKDGDQMHKFPAWMRHNSRVRDAYFMNDEIPCNPDDGEGTVLVNDATREAELIKFFEQYGEGDTIEFIN